METTWDNVQGSPNSITELTSDSTTRNFPKSKKESKVKFFLHVLKRILNLIFNTAAIVGWAWLFALLFDVLFLNGRIIEWILVGS